MQKDKRKAFSVIGLGGSLIVPASGNINILFLKQFRRFILEFVRRGERFIIVVGGGRVARTYQQAAKRIGKLSFDDADWLGIHATRMNAHLLRTIFRKWACPVVLDNPHKKLNKRILSKYPIVIAAGWKPGWSTDYIAVLLAKRFRVKQILDAGNIPFVYTRDKMKYKNAKPILQITWREYQKLVGRKWTPGMSSPIDPVAASEARKSNIDAVVFLGTDLQNFRNILEGKTFRGTRIGNEV
jgi:uridylate kinase